MRSFPLLAPLFIATVLTTDSTSFAAQPAVTATANPTAKARGPRLELAEKTFDFGTVKPSDVVRRQTKPERLDGKANEPSCHGETRSVVAIQLDHHTRRSRARDDNP